MNIEPTPQVLALSFASVLLSACGGGGMVRANPPPASLPPASPPPVPAPASTGPCPMPITGDCVVTAGATMLGGRDTSGSLLVRAHVGQLILGNDDPSFDALLGRATYNFAGGTVIESGVLQVRQHNTLASPVTVRRHEHSRLQIAGTVNGNVANAGSLELSGSGVVNGDLFNEGGATLWGGRINGNLQNAGRLHVAASIYERGVTRRISGDFTQTAAGEAQFDLAPADQPLDASGTLYVEGRAYLAGTLMLVAYQDDWGPYPLPGLGSYKLIHADGGVFGQFARWASPGLFIEGGLRYGSNDVWFDLMRISVQAAMTTAGASPLTLASATNFDRALAGADRFAGVTSTSLSSAQQGFLRSAGTLLWMSDAQQAQRSLASFSGSVHADALHAVGQGDAMSSALGQRLLTLQPGQVSGSWSQAGADGTVAGFDQWLGSRLVLGASTSMGNYTEAGGQARDHERQTALYLRWFGDDGWYAGGSAGFAHHALTIDRPIDLGAGGRRNAHSQRGISVASLESEAGRRFTLGGGVFAPYASVRAQAIRSERALEQGATGLELALQATTQARLSAGLGLRYGKRFQFGERGWLQMDADARMQHALAQAGSPLHAAFIGVPDVGFALLGSIDTTTGWMSLGLRGGTAAGWGWSLGHAGSFVGTRPDRQWALGLQRRF